MSTDPLPAAEAAAPQADPIQTAADRAIAIDGEGPTLGPGSSVDRMKARLKQLGAPIYGTKSQLWSRLIEKENLVLRKRKEQEYLAARRDQLQIANEPTESAILGGPEEPTPEVRAEHIARDHFPPARWPYVHNLNHP